MIILVIRGTKSIDWEPVSDVPRISAKVDGWQRGLYELARTSAEFIVTDVTNNQQRIYCGSVAHLWGYLQQADEPNCLHFVKRGTISLTENPPPEKATSVAIFVREKNTYRFVAQDGTWVPGFDESRKFRTTWEAADFCQKFNLAGAQIVMRLGTDERFDIVIDVPHDPRQPKRRKE